MNKYGKANQRRHRRIERGNRMPERIAYEPPSGVELEWFSCYYNPHVTIFHRLKRYRGMVAAFTLQVRETDDSQQSMHCIFRYDMAMPEPDLHQHELHPGGDNTGERRIIETIPDDGTGLVFVDKAYKRLADDMVRIAGQQYERWCSEK